MGHKWQFHVRFVEYQGILVGLELYWTTEMRFVHFSVRGSSLKLNPTGIQRAANAAMRHSDDPRETHVHQQRWLLLMREKPDKLDSGLIPPFYYTDLLRTGELFVARQPLDGVPKRPRGDRGDLNRVVPLDAILGPQLQPKGG